MLVPSATVRARIAPYGVRTAIPAPYGLRVRAGVFSWTRTPRSRQARFRPQASFAGCSIATPLRSKRPASKVGESTCSRTAPVSRYSMPSARPLARISSYHFSSSRAWYGSVATSISPVRSKSQSMEWRATVSSMASRLRAPSRSKVWISSGQRASPLGRPWVREAAQNPPLRPEAAQPTSRPSTRTTSRAGSRSLAISAVHSPLYPPPTTSRSQVSAPVSAGSGPGLPGSSSQ